jgi:hypothetical protein
LGKQISTLASEDESRSLQWFSNSIQGRAGSSVTGSKVQAISSDRQTGRSAAGLNVSVIVWREQTIARSSKEKAWACAETYEVGRTLRWITASFEKKQFREHLSNVPVQETAVNILAINCEFSTTCSA